MEEIANAATVEPHVPGSVSDVAHAIQFAREDRLDKSPHDLSQCLAAAPILPLNSESRSRV